MSAADRLAPFVTDLIEEMTQHNDVLVQLNALELLSDIASSSEAGAQYLHRLGVISQLYEVLTKSVDGPDSGFIFTGNLLYHHHHPFSRMY
jgi:hypothetical protein